jgi:membrane protease YdiL (CAAX protease family)
MSELRGRGGDVFTDHEKSDVWNQVAVKPPLLTARPSHPRDVVGHFFTEHGRNGSGEDMVIPFPTSHDSKDTLYRSWSHFVREEPLARPKRSHQGWLLVLVTTLTAAVTFGLGIAGLCVAKRAHLNPMPLVASDAGSLRKRFRALLPAMGIGVLCTVISILIVAAQLLFGLTAAAGAHPKLLRQHEHYMNMIKQLTGWQLLAVFAFGAPIGEEIQCRLFLVSVLAWLFGRLWKSKDPSRSPQVMWFSAIMSGLTFGLFHIIAGESVAWWRPIHVQLILDPRTYVGIVLAWLYWNRGIETSIVAHATLNVVAAVPFTLTRPFLHSGRVWC